MYDANNRSEFTYDDCYEMIGERATLTLTGTIIDAGESGMGAYVVFKLDDRWGFTQNKFVMDLDPLEFPDDA